MTTEAQDLFDRTLNGTWGNATDGQTWAATDASPTLNVTPGAGTIRTPQFSHATMRIGTISITDQEVTAPLLLGNNGDTAGVVVRADSAGNGYRFLIDGGDGIFFLDKMVNGVRSFIGFNMHASFVAGTVYTAKLQIIGTTLNAKYWTGNTEPSSWMLTNSDTDLTTGGFGIFASCASSSPITFKSFLADDTHVPPPAAILYDTTTLVTRGGTTALKTRGGTIQLVTRGGITKLKVRG